MSLSRMEDVSDRADHSTRSEAISPKGPRICVWTKSRPSRAAERTTVLLIVLEVALVLPVHVAHGGVRTPRDSPITIHGTVLSFAKPRPAAKWLICRL
jgi:hypothetical protein